MTIMSCSLGLASVAEIVIAHACLSRLYSGIQNSEASKRLETLYSRLTWIFYILLDCACYLKMSLWDWKLGYKEITEVTLATDKGREELGQKDMRSEKR